MEIIGLTKEQFTQIAMIAQGDFLRVLLASTEERKKIFRQLFGTERFGKLQERLAAEKRALENRRQTELTGLRQYLEAVECPPESPLYGDLLLARADELPAAEIPGLLDQLIAGDTAETEALDQELKQLAEQSSRMEQQLGAARQRAEAQKQLAAEQKALTLAQAEEEAAQKAQQQAEAGAERQKALTDRLAVAREKLPRYAELERAMLAAEERSSALNRAASRLEQMPGTGAVPDRAPGQAGRGAGIPAGNRRDSGPYRSGAGRAGPAAGAPCGSPPALEGGSRSGDRAHRRPAGLPGRPDGL